MVGDATIRQFLNRIASAEPTPGGGSAAAVAAALAAALISMVASLTAGKRGFEAVGPEMEHIIAGFGPKTEELMQMADKDAGAFEAVLAAYRLPKTTAAEKEARKSVIQAAMRNAALVPLAVAQIGADFLPSIELMIRQGNPNAITDAAVAALLTRSAVLGALYNVRVNLASISDQAFVEELRTKVLRLETVVKETETRLLALVDAKLDEGGN